MKITKIKSLLGVLHKSSDHMHMVGPHGIGKSEIVKQWAEENNYHIETLQLTVMDTSDLIGMPMIEDTEFGATTSFAKPEWIHRIHKANKDGKHCVVFFDELGRASHEIRQAALQMVLEGKIAEHSLGELDGLKSLCVVADNPSDLYDTADFDMALEDRFFSVDVEADAKAWLKYAKSKNVMTVITDYIAEHPEKLHWMPADDGSEKGPTPRAWKKLSDAMQEANESLWGILINGKIGKTTGANFRSFLRQYNKVVKPADVTEMLKDQNLGTKKEQEKAGDLIQKRIQAIETISVQELISKMKDGKTIRARQEFNTLLGAVNKEVLMATIQDWKADEASAEWFFNEYCKDSKGNPENWVIHSLVAASGVIDKKGK
jgi:hypothetical protein